MAQSSAVAHTSPVAQVSFDVDVMAVLSKAGCNAGACHGNQNGKGGFRLSLRGADPDEDYRTLVKGDYGRRLNPFAPDASLLLLKPLMKIPHEGGMRLTERSIEYEILRHWIAVGMPRQPQVQLTQLQIHPQQAVLGPEVEELTLTVGARFSDGSFRDVTALAVYESVQGPAEVDAMGRVRRHGNGEVTLIVRFLQLQEPVRLSFLGPRSSRTQVAYKSTADNYIDRWIEERLALWGVPFSPVCDDATFIRRVSLDLLGVVPDGEEARAFCEDTRSDKRAQLVDRYLARPEFAEHWALKWADLLRVEEKTLDARGVDLFYFWLRDALAADRPLDELVRDLLTARGSTYEVPPANFYRAHRDPFIRAETVARLFLGIRLQCARCHNHPFDRWTQDDYYSWASCFAGIDYEILQNDRRDKFDMHEFVGEQVVVVKPEGFVTNPRTGRESPPRLLAESTAFDPAQEDRLTHVSHWLASAQNPWFARVMANWVFYHLMGRGIVEPVDDFRLTNPPSHPELLDALAADLVENQFRLKSLVRRIVLSQAYQRAAQGQAEQDLDDGLFARAAVRRLTAEQTLDMIAQALDVSLEFAGYPPGTRAGQVRGVRRTRERERASTADDRFLRNFGRPERLLACECERNNELAVKQVLTLVGEEVQKRLRVSPRITYWANSHDVIAAIKEMFWCVLTRPPTRDELASITDYLSSATDKRGAWEDVVWALLTSREALFRH